MALEFERFLEESLEYGGGAGVAAGFAVFGVGRPTLGLRKYGFPYVALNLGSIADSPPLGMF